MQEKQNNLDRTLIYVITILFTVSAMLICMFFLKYASSRYISDIIFPLIFTFTAAILTLYVTFLNQKKKNPEKEIKKIREQIDAIEENIKFDSVDETVENKTENFGLF